MSDLPICYNSKEMNGWQVWQLRGRLDRTTAEEAAEEGEKQLAACRKLALDLSGLSYVSSAGLRTILKLAGGAEQAGKSIVQGCCIWDQENEYDGGRSDLQSATVKPVSKELRHGRGMQMLGHNAGTSPQDYPGKQGSYERITQPDPG